MEITQEQVRTQEISYTVNTSWWKYMMEDFVAKIEEYEEFIHDIDVPDIPEYSKKTIYTSYVNLMRTLINHPERLVSSMKSLEKK